MSDVPHFDYPFRFGKSNHAVEIEQDSIEDIEVCIATIIMTNHGDRVELPEFGTNSLLFQIQPLPIDQLYSDITDQEPRALMVISQQPDPLDYLTALVTVTVENLQPIGGT